MMPTCEKEYNGNLFDHLSILEQYQHFACNCLHLPAVSGILKKKGV